MPELPEVEIVTRGLKKEIVGKKINSIEISGTYKVHPSKEVFLKTLIGAKIADVERVAKVILCKLDSGKFLTFHLAMTGRLLYRKSGHKEELYQRVKFIFDDGTELRFSDLRMFGYAKVIDENELENLKTKYGPTPFHKDLTPEKLLEILGQRKSPIKKVLLEQDVIAGLGNIYANDALWMAKIHPETLTTKITLDDAKNLLSSMQEILKEGLLHGGSTIKDFVDIYGNPGSHQHHFRVYGKENKPCPNCKTEVKMTTLGGRSTFYCPNCQKVADEKLTLF